MSKTKNLNSSIAVIILTIFISVIMITVGIVLSNHKENPKPWVLQSYGNTVALYSGDEIIEVYGTINTDVLPEDDKLRLDKGIVFPTKEDAINAIEDFDG